MKPSIQSTYQPFETFASFNEWITYIHRTLETIRRS
jgi:hypothetical protein